MERALRAATLVSTALLLIGLAMLLAYSVAEAIANPGYSLVDGYWRGRLPWMGIIEAAVVGGATATLICGAAAVLARGGWIRRLASILLLGPPALWWFAAYIQAGVGGAYCPGCPPPPFDPWAYAYSVPATAGLMLVLPALATAALALSARAKTPYISPS
ncbi:MAG TPA: hypothetical protein VF013_05450 [Candidatus Limnocylindria bacterium]